MCSLSTSVSKIKHDFTDWKPCFHWDLNTVSLRLHRRSRDGDLALLWLNLDAGKASWGYELLYLKLRSWKPFTVHWKYISEQSWNNFCTHFQVCLCTLHMTNNEVTDEIDWLMQSIMCCVALSIMRVSLLLQLQGLWERGGRLHLALEFDIWALHCEQFKWGDHIRPSVWACMVLLCAETGGTLYVCGCRCGCF